MVMWGVRSAEKEWGCGNGFLCDGQPRLGIRVYRVSRCLEDRQSVDGCDKRVQMWSGGFEPPYTVRHGIKSTATLPELQHWVGGLSALHADGPPQCSNCCCIHSYKPPYVYNQCHNQGDVHCKFRLHMMNLMIYLATSPVYRFRNPG